MQKRREEMSKDNCDLINLSRWLLDIVSDIMDCNCKTNKKS